VLAAYLYADLYHFSLVAVGICRNRSERKGMPGWEYGSWAYHGDDGMKFSEVGIGAAYGPTYSTGDVVGCGLEIQTGCVFFTKNGENLGEFQMFDKFKMLTAVRNCFLQYQRQTFPRHRNW
jgi:hypothetical protein